MKTNLALQLFNEPFPVRVLCRVIARRLHIGSYSFRLSIGAVVRPNYAYLVNQAARLAALESLRKLAVPDTLIPILDKFNYWLCTSNGLREGRMEYYDKQYPGVLNSQANTKRVKMLMADGSNARITIAESTYMAGEKNLYDALATIERLPVIKDKTLVMRLETPEED